MMTADEMKQVAALRALEFVRDGMRLGIGTGSTAEEFIKLLGARVADGLDIIGVPTSERSRLLCEKLHIKLTTLDDCPELDLDIDGTDEIDRALHLVKGGGGALLREKIVAQAAREVLIITDYNKLVERLGAFALPVEVNPFGLQATWRAIERLLAGLNLNAEPCLRKKNGGTFVTDGGHYILDIPLQSIPDPQALSLGLHTIAGVVEHGLFLGLTSKAIIAQPDGRVEILTK